MTKMRMLVATALGLTLLVVAVGASIASTPRTGGAAAPLTDQHQAAAPTDAPDLTDGSSENEGTDADGPVTGPDRDAAGAAATAYTDGAYATGGVVTEVEIGDGGTAFGVEVRLPDGRQVEVRLDAAFTVIGDELDDD